MFRLFAVLIIRRPENREKKANNMGKNTVLAKFMPTFTVYKERNPSINKGKL